MNNTYRIRQCPRILLNSDEQPSIETCRMLRQQFGFDWNKRGFFWFYEPKFDLVTVTEEQLQPLLARLVHGVVPEDNSAVTNSEAA